MDKVKFHVAMINKILFASFQGSGNINLSDASLTFPNQMVKMSKSSGGVLVRSEKALGSVIRSWKIKNFFWLSVVDAVMVVCSPQPCPSLFTTTTNKSYSLVACSLQPQSSPAPTTINESLWLVGGFHPQPPSSPAPTATNELLWLVGGSLSPTPVQGQNTSNPQV